MKAANAPHFAVLERQADARCAMRSSPRGVAVTLSNAAELQIGLARSESRSTLIVRVVP